MKMICDRCWERRCRCSPIQREADRQKIIEEFRKAEGLPPEWQPGSVVITPAMPEDKDAAI